MSILDNVVEVTGGTERQRKYIKSIVYYCIGMLGMSRIRTLDIQVNIGARGMGDAEGLCCMISKREFEIDVKGRIRLRTLLETIAHEMVHVKQYVRGELVDNPVYHSSWKGESVDCNKVSYWDLPWEVEAHGREVGLFVRWAETMELGDKAWTHTR